MVQLGDMVTFVRIVDELAIRIGALQDSSYQAKPLTTIRTVIYASFEYLSKMGPLSNLTDLADHTFLY